MGKSDLVYVGIPISKNSLYARFKDKDGNVIVSNDGEEMFSPFNGRVMKRLSGVDYDSIAGLDADYGAKCKICNAKLVSTTNRISYCPQCGSKLGVSAEATDFVEGDELEDVVKELEEGEGEDLDLEDVDEEGKCREPVKSYVLISDLDLNQPVSSSDVTMTLFDDKDDPFWNITIKGYPVARVQLSDQPRASEIKNVFVSSEYADNVANAMEKIGVKNVLETINARLYADRIDQSKLAKRLEAKIDKKYSDMYKKKIADLRNNYKYCISLVLSGLNKNFFSDVDNILKASLWQSLREAGINNAMEYIESAFEASADQFFDTVLTKAEEYMELPKEALDEIAKAIGNSNVIIPTTVEAEVNDLGSKLEEGNFIVSTALYSGSVPTAKEELKSMIKLGKKM